MVVSCGINTIPTDEEKAKASWSEVQNQYQRRADLIPNLVETVKGYAAHERGTLEAVVQARQTAVAAPGVEQKVAAENMLTGALGRADAVICQSEAMKADLRAFVGDRTAFHKSVDEHSRGKGRVQRPAFAGDVDQRRARVRLGFDELTGKPRST